MLGDAKYHGPYRLQLSLRKTSRTQAGAGVLV